MHTMGESNMKVWKKALVLVALAVTFGGLVATQYAKVGVQAQLTLDAKGAYITPVGLDKGAEGYVLANISQPNSDYVYALKFGVWANMTTKAYSASYLVVNRESVPIYLKGASVSYSQPAGTKFYITVWAHGDPTHLANSSLDSSADTHYYKLYPNPPANTGWGLNASFVSYAKNTVQFEAASGYGGTTTTATGAAISCTWTEWSTGSGRYIWAVDETDTDWSGTTPHQITPPYQGTNAAGTAWGSDAVYIEVDIEIIHATESVSQVSGNIYLIFTTDSSGLTLVS